MRAVVRPAICKRNARCKRMGVAGVVLAAGFSQRLGRPKQAVPLAGETLIERAVRTAREAGLEPVFVVASADAAFVENLSRLLCAVVMNPDAAEGMASSIRVGVSAAQAKADLEGLVVMTCDQPGTRPAHLRALYADRQRVTGSGYAGRVAVPAYFPRSCFDQLLALQGDQGARGLLQGAPCVQAEELAVDVDSEEDVLRARMLFEH